MPRFNCESCEATLYSAARPGNLIDPSCPSCGAPFEAQREVERWDDEGGSFRRAAVAPVGATAHTEVA